MPDSPVGELPTPDVIVVMGVSGSGKTTVATGIATAMEWEFAEGDDFHPAANVEKMRRGRPLTDDDRWPWLEAIGAGRTSSSKVCMYHPPPLRPITEIACLLHYSTSLLSSTLSQCKSFYSRPSGHLHLYFYAELKEGDNAP